MRLLDHDMPLPDPLLCNAFFNTWFSRASWPEIRSNSAIRCSCVLDSPDCGGRNALSPRSWYSLRQRESTLSAKPYSRQACAGRFCPLAIRRTTSSLNSRLCMRFCIVSSPCLVRSLHYFGEVDFIHCPVSGVQSSLHLLLPQRERSSSTSVGLISEANPVRVAFAGPTKAWSSSRSPLPMPERVGRSG